MTKEELEKKKSELLYLFKEFDGDRKVEFIKKFPEIWNDCYDIMEESRYHRVMQNSFQSGFDSAVSLLLPRLEEAEKREIHLENCVEQLYDIIALSDFITKRESDMAVKIYNEAEIVVRDEKKNE